MARVLSDITKFKRLEADLRRVTRDLAETIRKIEKVLEANHSADDRATLARAKADWIAVHEFAKRALAEFWDRVEMTK